MKKRSSEDVMAKEDAKRGLVMEKLIISPRKIVEAHYCMDPTVNRLFKMALYKLEIQGKIVNPEVSFTVDQYFKVFNINEFTGGGTGRKILEDACNKLANQYLVIRRDFPDSKGDIFKRINVVSSVSHNCNKNDAWAETRITVSFTQDIAPLLAEYKLHGFSKLELEDFAKLGGFYAQRFYEILKINEGLGIDDGNSNKWTVAYTPNDIRDMLMIENISDNKVFNRDVIKNSVNKINEADISIKVGIKEKRIKADCPVHFNVTGPTKKQAPLSLDANPEPTPKIIIAPAPKKEKRKIKKRNPHIIPLRRGARGG